MKGILRWNRVAFGAMALTSALLGSAATAATIPLEVAEPIRQHMVLQRGQKISVWGKNTTGRAITVSDNAGIR